MRGIHDVLKNRQGNQNSDGKSKVYSCAVCGGKRYHLVLTAEALNTHVGLTLRCSTCHASQNVFDSVRTPHHALFTGEHRAKILSTPAGW
jgi:hypothetical protein